MRAMVMGAVAAVTLAAGGASGATVVAEFTGTVAGGANSVDGLGLFKDLETDRRFNLTFVFDTDLGTTYVDSASDTLTLAGGGEGPFSSPLISATMTIGSTSYSIGSTASARLMVSSQFYGADARESVLNELADGSTLRRDTEVWGYVGTPGEFPAADRLNLPVDLENPFSLDLSQRGFLLNDGLFNAGYVSCVGEVCSVVGRTYLALETQGLKVTVDGVSGPDITPSVVPLPASAALLSLGLVGLAGLRRVRR